ncbi:hypothetical protein PFICI_12426 [Pestalotiopsis fici W106-1]|uniref:Major facilitator superfamily (MFS) profile domain-containing protein n=1 Tax=Pestalotiopsis fici (strain W106-1 / CGMCC3.15140) TaxID=1229662 RepID=W3WQQ7_PESFW|nr:uncharacterized protein PFICI_12426 [Pestalotiopsis fici W106-1]ETS75482.1 hypothetical protein PFICI_12426 [Pestalotiopsis fici W106-1]
MDPIVTNLHASDGARKPDKMSPHTQCHAEPYLDISYPHLPSTARNHEQPLEAPIDGVNRLHIQSKNEIHHQPISTAVEITLGTDALELSFSMADCLKSYGVDDAQISILVQTSEGFQSPHRWSTFRKTKVLIPPFLAAVIGSYAAGAYSPGSEQMQQQWQVSETLFDLGLLMYVVAFAFAPMTLAPISELYGRYWVYVGSGLVLFLGTVGCAFAPSLGPMLFFRLVAGCGGSVYSTLTGGVLADVYLAEARSTPMAIYMLLVFIGIGLGPMVSGLVVDAYGWRWIFYIQLIAIGVVSLASGLLFEETRANVILRSMCNALNRASNRNQPSPRADHICTIFQAQQPQCGSIIPVLRQSYAFPLRLLFREAVVFLFSAWASFAWTVLNMQYSSIGITFREVYNFNSFQVGLVYNAILMGAIISTLITIILDSWAMRLWPQRMSTPEGRLLLPGVLSILLPAGLFCFGWTAKITITYWLPMAGIGVGTVGIFSIYLASTNYLADTYGPFTSSAIAAQSMCRNLSAGVIYLLVPQMLEKLRYSGTGSLLGGIGLALTAIPWLLAMYGVEIRRRSPFAGTLANM